MIKPRYTIAFCLFCYSAVLCGQTSPFLILDGRNLDNPILKSGQLSFKTSASSKPNFDLATFESNAISTGSYLRQMKAVFTELPADKQNILLLINGFTCQRKSSIIANGELLAANFLDQVGADIGLFTSFNWTTGASYRKTTRQSPQIGYYYADILLQVIAELKSINPEVKFHLITHSMGNRVFTGLYKRLVEKGQKNIFAHHIMSAPDVEPTIFESGEELEHLDEISKYITIYTHSKDRILTMGSSIVNENRLGLTSLDDEQLDKISPHISVIDCSETNDLKALNLGRHNYCKKSETVTEDIYYTLTGQIEKAMKRRVPTQHPRKFLLRPVEEVNF